MRRIIDLTMTIEPHFRWPLDRSLRADFAKGDQFQVTYAGMVVHGFTHVDTPRHIDPEGFTTSELSLDRLVGEAAVVDLTAVAANEEILPSHLQAAGGHIGNGDIVLLKTAWDRRISHHEPAFWQTAPYLSRAGTARTPARRRPGPPGPWRLQERTSRHRPRRTRIPSNWRDARPCAR